MSKTIRKGNDAKNLLDNKLVKEALKDIRENTMHKWSQTKGADNEAREVLYWQLRGLDAFEQQLNLYITHGKKALYEVNNGRIKP